MEYKKGLEQNIWKMYIYRVFQCMMFFYPIFVLFLLDNGLSMTQVMILQAYYAVIVLLLEVPTGALADIFGRKITIAWSSIILFIGFTVYSMGYGFFAFLIAETLCAFSGALWSGTDTAFIYDTLKGLKKQKQFKKVYGNYMALNFLFFGIAALIGAYLATFSLRFPFQITLIPMALATIIPFTFTEPRIKKHRKTKYWQHIKETVGYAFKHKKLKFLIIYSAILWGMGEVVYMLWQPYFKLVGIPIISFGIIFFALQITSAISSKFAHKIEDILGEKKILFLLVLAEVIIYFLFGFFASVYIIILLVLFGFIFGMSYPIITDYMNKHTKSHHRATMMSVGSLSARIVFSVTSPMFGVIVDFWSLQTAFKVSSIIFAIDLLILIFMFWVGKSKTK